MNGPGSSTDLQDRLVARLRERAGDADRRVDSRPAEFSASLSGLDASELFSSGRSAAQDLQRLLDHGVEDELLVKADRGKSIEDPYDELGDSATQNPRWVWPAGLVPLVD